MAKTSYGISDHAGGQVFEREEVEFVPHLYDYVEKGGTGESAKQLGVDEHAVVKTLVFETNEKEAA